MLNERIQRFINIGGTTFPMESMIQGGENITPWKSNLSQSMTGVENSLALNAMAHIFLPTHEGLHC